MKKIKLNLAVLAIVIVGATAIVSCKKKDTTSTPATSTTVDSDQSGAAANNTAESISSDIVSMGSEACDMSSNGSLSTYRVENQSSLACAAVTRDTINKIITVTFNGGTCLDGKTRSGSLIYNYSASTNGATHYRHPGFNLSVTSNNYVVNGNTVTINSKTITNITPAGFNHLTTNETWSITANISINLGTEGTVSWACNRVKTLLNTASAYTNSTTPISWSTARVGITGSASGSRSSNNETFTVNITNQLIRDFGTCSINGRHPFIQGTFVYSPSGKAARTFDYGNGSCDLNATITINNISYPFTLP
jgi:hypothetical protein